MSFRWKKMESEFHCVFPFWLGVYEELPNWKLLWRRIFSVVDLGLILFYFLFFISFYFIFFCGMGNTRKRIKYFVESNFISHKKVNRLLLRQNLQNNIILKLCFWKKIKKYARFSQFFYFFIFLINTRQIFDYSLVPMPYASVN